MRVNSLLAASVHPETSMPSLVTEDYISMPSLVSEEQEEMIVPVVIIDV